MIKFALNNKIFLVLLSINIIVSRLVVFYFYRDLGLENEWGTLFHNLQTTGVLGFNVILDNNTVVQKFAEVGDEVIPSVWMPPFYVFFIYILNIIFGNIISLVNVIILFQIILNLISIFLFYLIIRKFLSEKISLLLTIFYTFFPAIVFSSVQISSITIQIFLIICFFYFFLQIIFKFKKSSLIIFSIISGVLILTRGEFIIFFIFSLFYFYIIKELNIKNILSSLLIASIVVSPYLYRNYKNFNTIVLTKSFGYNLLKGNNENFKVEGDVKSINKIRNNITIPSNNNFEIKVDDIYKNEAIKYIKDNPLIFVKNYLKKFFSFLIMDLNSSYPNYYHPAHIVPKLIISIATIISAFIGLKKKGFFQYFSLYYFLNISLFSIFFILPRYSVILIPVQLFLIGFAFKYCTKK